MSLTLDGTTGISATGNIYGNNIIVTNTLTAGVFSPTNLSASGNITASFFIGNGSQLTGIDATQIQSGTSNVKVVSSGGNATVGIAGTDNVAVFASTGVFVTGVASASGNTIGGNVLTAGIISSTGNVTGGNILTAGLITATGNIQGGNLRTAGLISATGAITSGGTGTFVGLSAGGGNVSGANFTTPGLITATGAITGAALTGTSLTVSTGNITGGNLLISGAIIDSAQLDIQTSASNANIAMAPNGTGIVTVSTQVSAVGNVTGGNIRTAGLISATGSITTAGDISITGNIVDGAALTIITSSNGNITMAPNGTGVVVVNTDIRNGQSTGVGNIGASGATFNTIFAKATSAQYADLAEMYESDKQLDAGQVVEFGGTKEIQQTTTSHSTSVAGIISTNPSYIMNAALDSTADHPHVYPVALTGRVPCYVVGKISKGDRLVASDQRGVATALDINQYQPGCIIGKALEDYNSQEIGRIEVAVGRF